jgi:Dockerin type I domain
MPRHRTHRRPLPLEPLESRLPLSAPTPANSIGTSLGGVLQPHGVTPSTVLVAPKNLTVGKSSTLFGVFVQPTSGSDLAPRIVAVEQGNGQKLAIKQGRPFVRGRANGEAAAFVKVTGPGPLTVFVGGQKQTTGSFELDVTLAGDVNGDGTVNLADLQSFAPTYETVPGNPNFNPAADFNQNGIVNLYDAKALMQNMTPLTPNEPLAVVTNLSPADQAHYPTPRNSGGATSKQDVTILGKTIPGSIVLIDGPNGLFRFNGGAVATDGQGRFSVPETLSQGVNTFTFLILDPFGKQMIRSFPVFWLPVGAPGSKLN